MGWPSIGTDDAINSASRSALPVRRGVEDRPVFAALAALQVRSGRQARQVMWARRVPQGARDLWGPRGSRVRTALKVRSGRRVPPVLAAFTTIENWSHHALEAAVDHSRVDTGAAV